MLFKNKQNAAKEKKPVQSEQRCEAQWNLSPIQGIKHIIIVASGKGGVGKSTVTAQLASSLLKQGKHIGILDADIYGPSMPRMLGTYGKPEVKDGKLMPLESNGCKCISMGHIAGDGKAVIWRAAMVTKALKQMLHGVAWGELDYLLIDSPPGTGDIHLSLAQSVLISAAIIVTTPQEVATEDAAKCLQMFQKTGVPIAGIIENMSGFTDPVSGNTTHIFGKGGGRMLAETYNVDFLGEVPLDPSIRETADSGNILNAHESFAAIVHSLTNKYH